MPKYKKHGGNPGVSGEMGLVEKIKKVMLSPSEFFDKVKSERGIGTAFKYLAIVSLVNLVVGVVGYFLPVPFLSPLGGLINILSLLGALVAPIAIVALVLNYIGGLILSFIGAGFIHLFAKLLKGGGDYGATYRALVYASTPILLLGWVPWVSIIFALYSLYLGIKGISKLHEVTMLRSFVIVFVIPLVIGLIIGVVFVGLSLVYWGSAFAR